MVKNPLDNAGAEEMLFRVVKNPLDNAGDRGDAVSIPESQRSPGGGNGKPLQNCLKNSMDKRSLEGYSP